MSRRRKSVKRKITPDSKYSSLLVAKFINFVMEQGKKTVAETIVYDAFDMMQEKGKKEGDEFDWDWRRLLPDWLIGAYDSTRGMVGRRKDALVSYFADIAIGIKNRMLSIIDSIADINRLIRNE